MSHYDNKVRPFAFATLFLLGVGALAFAISSCDENHYIGDLPEVDPCAIEGVEDCAPECDVCIDNYDVGFDDGVDSVLCTTPEPECEDDVDSDCSDDTHKRAHKRCRGKGHHKSEPISTRTCRTRCYPGPYGTRYCTTTCTGSVVA